MTPTIEIDVVMIFIAGAVNMGLGILWYSPSIFGKKWMKAVGMTTKAKQKDMEKTYLFAFLSSLLAAFVLEVFIENVPGSGAYTGLMVGFWAGIGFVATTHLVNHLFDPYRNTNELYFINVGYHIVSLMIMGFLLGI